jgi:predicted SAM-dependent methyltransferase
VFEHFDPATGARFLAECRRCLETDGIVRIVVPDAGRYLRLYSGGWDGFVPVRPLVEENGTYRDYWLGNIYRTKMEFINEVFRQGIEHKYAYDAETLILKFADAGFTRIVEQHFRTSMSSDEPLDLQSRSGDSLYVEAMK